MPRPKGSKNLPKTAFEPNQAQGMSVEDALSTSLRCRECLQILTIGHVCPVSEDGLTITTGIPCDYACFSLKPIPVDKISMTHTYSSRGREPVWEIKIETKDPRYKVDSILYSEHGLIISAHGRRKLIPLANVAYAQPI